MFIGGVEWYSSYRSDVRVSGRGKVFNVRGTALMSMYQFLTVGSISDMVGEWSHRDECL